jgi:hypothetical protein
MVKSDQFLADQLFDLRNDLIEAIKNKVPENTSVFFTEYVGDENLDERDKIKGVSQKNGYYGILFTESPRMDLDESLDYHDILFDILEKLDDEGNEFREL